MNERQSKILEFIESHGSAQIRELQAIVPEYTPMTLWRDLSKLEELGYVRRFRGGAAAVRSQYKEQEQSFSYRLKKNVSEKEEITRIAVGLLNPYHALYLDGGSTTYSLAKQLPDGHFTIITSSANIAVELSQRNGYNVNLLGGQVIGTTLACSGPQAEDMLGSMNVDMAVLSTSGFSLENGFASGYLSEAHLKRRVIEKASSCIVMLMDQGKIGKVQPFTFGMPRDIDILITDAELPSNIMEEMEKNQVKVFYPGDGYGDMGRRNWLEAFLLEKNRIPASGAKANG